jgi:GNAT superfamily N-acetyltransferase
MTTTWLRFTWDLAKVPSSTTGSEIPTPYQLRDASAEEEEVIQKVAYSAFSMDSGWGNLQSPFVENIRKQVAAAFEKDAKSRVLALLHGSRIIGTSVLGLEDGATNHLVTGPCILHEYRSRGLGSQLLCASLLALREAGLKKAFGVTRDKTTSARFIYPKFGGLPEPWNPEFEPAPKIAA